MQKKNLKEKLNKFGKYLKDIVFPRNLKCIFCKEELNQNEMNSTCEVCLQTLPFITNACPRCGGVLPKEATGVCVDCKINNYDFISAFSVFEYKNEVVSVIHNLKYNGKTYLVKPIAKFMAQRFATENIEIDFLTSVPIHAEKFKVRGFNQSELLAKGICELLGYKYLELCQKVINTKSQTELNFSERKDNVKDSFAFNKQFKGQVKGKSVLIIDDIFTTGATSNEICKVLLKAGVAKCYVLTFAHVNINRLTSNN